MGREFFDVDRKYNRKLLTQISRGRSQNARNGSLPHSVRQTPVSSKGLSMVALIVTGGASALRCVAQITCGDSAKCHSQLTVGDLLE
jgi:hypothetical protein